MKELIDFCSFPSIPAIIQVMPSLPSEILVHKTRLLRQNPDDLETVQLFVGKSRDHTEYAVWIEKISGSEKALIPVGFSDDPQAAADRYNSRLQDLAGDGYRADKEQMVDSEFILSHMR